MCVIVDTNLLSTVFEKNAENHDHFADLLNWITEGKVRLTVGGTRYKNEFDKLSGKKYRKLVKHLNDGRLIVYADDELVDNREKEYTSLKLPKDHDDPHVVALAYVSTAKMICTNDNGLVKFLKARKFRKSGDKKPKIYGTTTRKSVLKLTIFKPVCILCKQ